MPGLNIQWSRVIPSCFWLWHWDKWVYISFPRSSTSHLLDANPSALTSASPSSDLHFLICRVGIIILPILQSCAAGYMSRVYTSQAHLWALTQPLLWEAMAVRNLSDISETLTYRVWVRASPRNSAKPHLHLLIDY